MEDYALEASPNGFFMMAVADHVSYSVFDMQTDVDSAPATFVVETPDFLALLDDLPELEEKGLQLLQQWLPDRLANGDVPTHRSIQAYPLLRESTGWKVFVGWKAPKAREGQRGAIAARATRDTSLWLAVFFAGAVAYGLLVGCFLRLFGRLLGHPRWLLAVVVLHPPEALAVAPYEASPSCTGSPGTDNR